MKKLIFLCMTLSIFVSGGCVFAETTSVPYEILGENSDGTLNIYVMAKVATPDSEPSTAGADIEIKKYGIINHNGEILLEPILDFTSLYNAPFQIEFDENGLSEESYDAAYYYYGGQNTLWTPAETKKILVNSNYKTWRDYDVFYDNFITENRFIVKGDGKSVLIDYDMNVITNEYTHIIELDDGKWYASTDTSQTSPVYTIVLDHEGSVLTDFNPANETNMSQWAEQYIEKADALEITTKGKTTAFNTSFFTEKITRIEFCRLAVNTLKALQMDLPVIENHAVFADTKDENVLICYELGIIAGTGNGTFNPYANITREGAAKILVSLADVLGIDTSQKNNEAQFTDYAMASDWAKEFILQVSALETTLGECVMSGTSSTTFSPLATFTVEQSVATLTRMYDLKANIL